MSSTVGSLIISTDEAEGLQDKELPVDSNRYRTTAAIIDLGLQILETDKGRESLLKVATETIKERRKKNKYHLYDNRSLDEMPEWIDSFLTNLRGNFPYVYLKKMTGEGMTIKYDWGDSMDTYNPKSAVELHLNRTVRLFS
jgi:hypothetical protein